MSYTTDIDNPQWSQANLVEILNKLQSEKNSNIDSYQPFIFNNRQIIDQLDFNIKGLTAISTMEQTFRPGLAPDWGTNIFESIEFHNIAFNNCNFRWLNLSNTKFSNCAFFNCNFEGAVFENAIIENGVFYNCNLDDAVFQKAKLNDVLFKNNHASYSSFLESTLEKVQFHSNNLHGSNFFGAHFDSSTHLDNTEDVLIQYNTNINKPVILITSYNKKPMPAFTKVVKRLKELNTIPFKFNFGDTDIDVIKLKEEVDLIIGKLKVKYDASLPKQILDFAANGNFNEISKIKNKAREWVDFVDGVIVPGGQDVQPFFYKQAPEPQTELTADLRRDLFEFAILDAVDARGIPLLGICRGMQIDNIWRGGTLFQHVPRHLFCVQEYTLHDSIKNDSAPSIMAQLFGNSVESFTGYSLHHQAVDRIGKGLTLIASSSDGTIKALEMLGANRFHVLVQWHPEYKGDTSTPESAQLEAKLSAGNTELFKRFVQALN